MEITLGNDWDEFLAAEFSKPYYGKLREFLAKEYANKTIYPPQHQIFAALKHTPYARTKVVILGQDPYHGPGQAHGLAFSVTMGVDVPPSLRNIFKELTADVGAQAPEHGSLLPWANQGVLLLNTTLTVEGGQAGSHQGQGWEQFTDASLRHLNEKASPVVFLLWGKHAQGKGALITNSHHLVLTAPHPSPLSAYRGFFGSGHFSQTNKFLIQTGQEPIDWQIL